ncbi:MAG: DUF4268 domain-containing protein [Mojavia pulchra JT2-VF2]|jgi:CBS domain-containing protein|uniref:DUF4268 domain-containing protein n=1 Tax=Mojavia pulchra JT2-VF2 TaxID=287848 RepID=A0A951Q1W5_9NOST|nr:DUF4268 domain-containing protein [Mojavia pulchra JT2-VF2]
MPFTVQDLIKDKQKPVTVYSNDSVQKAVDLMIEYDFSQIPVVDNQDKLLGIVTSDSILRALKNLNVTLSDLTVNPHAMSKMSKKHLFTANEELFALLDTLKDTYAVIIVDVEGKVTGIVTSYDTTDYFRRRAEDTMLVEDIESMIKDYVRAAFNQAPGEDDTQELKEVIKECLGSRQENIGRFRNGVNSYLKISNNNQSELNQQFLEEAFSKSFENKQSGIKSFDELTLFEYSQLFLNNKSWSHYGTILGDKKAMSGLLDNVRKTRNRLAHFRDEISATQRDQLRYCSDLLERCQSVIVKSEQVKFSEFIEDTLIHSEQLPNDKSTVLVSSTEDIILEAEEITPEEITPEESPLALLALYLQNQPVTRDKLMLKFKDIENTIKSELPTVARRHRSWWANDSVNHPQSQQWLNIGWCVSTVDISAEEVTFSRIKKQQKAYIDFFSALIAKLEESAKFSLKPPQSQDGRHFVSIAGIPEGGAYSATLAFAFTRSNQLRVELYIAKNDQQENKRIFDSLHKRKNEIEAELGENLSWESHEYRRESRIALYHHGSINDSEEKLANLQKWAVNAMIRFQKVMNEKVSEVLYEYTNKPQI